MQFLAIKRVFMSATRGATERFRDFRRERRARVALKDLSQHLLDDIGQADYYERRELDQDEFANSIDPFRR